MTTEIKTGPDYVRAYNSLAAQLGKPPVKRFPDLKTAERRLAEIEAIADGEADATAASGKRVLRPLPASPDHEAGGDALVPVTQCPPGAAKGVRKPRAAKAAKVAKEGKPNGAARKAPAPGAARNVRGFYFKRQPGAAIKDPRPNTKRAKVLEMMLSAKGTTHEEVMAAIGWDARTAYEGIRLINIEHGYGIDHDEKTGRVHAYADKADSWGA